MGHCRTIQTNPHLPTSSTPHHLPHLPRAHPLRLHRRHSILANQGRPQQPGLHHPDNPRHRRPPPLPTHHQPSRHSLQALLRHRTQPSPHRPHQPPLRIPTTRRAINPHPTHRALPTRHPSPLLKPKGKKLMATYRISIPAPAKFISANDRLHHMQRAKLTKAWREAAKEACKHLPPLTPPVHILASIQKPRAGRWDPNNLNGTTKAIVDGIVDAGIIPDDSWKEVIGPDHRRGPKGPEAIILTIEEQE